MSLYNEAKYRKYKSHIFILPAAKFHQTTPSFNRISIEISINPAYFSRLHTSFSSQNYQKPIATTYRLQPIKSSNYRDIRRTDFLVVGPLFRTKHPGALGSVTGSRLELWIRGVKSIRTNNPIESIIARSDQKADCRAMACCIWGSNQGSRINVPELTRSARWLPFTGRMNSALQASDNCSIFRVEFIRPV